MGLSNGAVAIYAGLPVFLVAEDGIELHSTCL